MSNCYCDLAGELCLVCEQEEEMRYKQKEITAIKDLQRKLDRLTGGLSSNQLNRKRGIELQIRAKRNKLKEF